MFRDEGIAHFPDLPTSDLLAHMVCVWRLATIMRLEHAPPPRLARVVAAERPS